jgi:8-oxo-dGTP pyrophosphatase MutT (NUDIX family)
MRVEGGERIALGAEVMLGAAAVVFDPNQRLLLIQRTDNEEWCLPGGKLDAGESMAEACLRELYEETGLLGKIDRILGLYSSPDSVVVYRDGVRRQVVTVTFLVTPQAEARLEPGAEALDARYFERNEIEDLAVLELHKIRIADAFAEGTVFVR